MVKKIIVVSATKAEIANFLEQTSKRDETRFEFCITGVGMVATTYQLTTTILKIQSLGFEIQGILNIGIAGSFDKNLKIGQIVSVHTDHFSELGAQDDHRFLTLDQLGFGKTTFFDNKFLPKTGNDDDTSIPITCVGITVNTVHGNEKSIHDTFARLNPQTESMEGAAVFYVAKNFNLPVQQIRCISNYVEKRNKDNWDIPLAISNLNNWLHEYFYKQDSL